MDSLVPSSFGRPAGVSLRRLLADAEFLGAGDVRATSCSSDSRRVQPGDVFVAISGVEQDGHDFVAQAVARGASAVVVERALPAVGIPVCIVGDTRRAHAQLCHALAGFPSERLKVIGVTGTNGKTTTTHYAAAVLRAAGYGVGTLGTLGLDDGCEATSATHTTPPAPVTASWLSRMVENGCTHAVMEVSSHALSQHRVDGVEFDVACFTNIRRDHLDYHNSLVNYRRAKARLLERVAPGGTVVFNADDAPCVEIGANWTSESITFGLEQPAALTATLVEQFAGEQTYLLCSGDETAAVSSRMIGRHQMYNALAAAAIGRVYGIDLVTIARGIESIEQLAGRMERVDCGQPFSVFVDYAHTPDALETALQAARDVARGRVLCVFGAGGDRDARKRPLMGAAVENGADLAVITNDNPRSEDPLDIAGEIVEGFNRPSQAQVILDRERAIAWALGEARPGDVVLIAGKGHETYQEVKRQRYWLDDREVARTCLYRLAELENELGMHLG